MAEDLAVVNVLAMECQMPEVDEIDERTLTQRWAVPNLFAFTLRVCINMTVLNSLNMF